jgi:uncharacterized protein
VKPHTEQAEPVGRVASLTIYPLKSGAGVEVTTLELDALGAIGDRRWLLVDEDGAQITARTAHALLRIQPVVDLADRDGDLKLTAVGYRALTVPVPAPDAERVTVQVWDDRLTALLASAEASAWCSEVIGRSCRLVRHGAVSHRPLQPKYTGGLSPAGRAVTFTDGAPLLLLGLSSIAALDARLLEQGASEPVDRRRFRANIWLDGTAPHAEDAWRSVRIGGVALGLGTLCPRCVLTTVDPDTFEQGVEPLRTLASYRRQDGGVVFGVNTTHASPGVLRCGETVTVTSWR